MSARLGATALSVLSGMWSALWPARCPLCGETFEAWDTASLCDSCSSTFIALREPFCRICGLNLEAGSSPAGGVCGKCLQQAPRFEAARAYGEYRGALSRAIKDFKFKGRRSLAPFLTRALSETCHDHYTDAGIEAVLPVPLHKSRLKERGFNHSADLARAAAREIDAPLMIGKLVRVKPTVEQAGLSPSARRNNVRGAFMVKRQAAVKDRKVLLVDDVLTTGATADECAKVLKKAGAKSVLVLTVARTP